MPKMTCYWVCHGIFCHGVCHWHSPPTPNSPAPTQLLLCSTQLPEHQRMNANGNGYQMIYFPEIIIQWDAVPVMVILYNCCTMHNNTHSVHNRLLKLWRVRLLPQWPCCYVPSPPLSGANRRPFPLSGGPGPPVSKMAPFSPGSTYTPSPLSATTAKLTLDWLGVLPWGKEPIATGPYLRQRNQRIEEWLHSEYGIAKEPHWCHQNCLKFALCHCLRRV